MMEELRELWRYRELLLVMTQRELRVRYKNSALGFLWSFINPLVTTLVMWVVFSKLLNQGTESYYAYVLVALLPFTFFQAAVLDGAQSILGALPIVKKVYFPREILPLASIFGNFFHLLVGYAVFVVFLVALYVITGFGASPFAGTMWWMLPPLLLISLFFGTGLGLLVAALNTFYEDVKYVTSVGMYLLFYLCPIIYFYEQVAHKLDGSPIFRFYMLNPIAVLSIAYRKALLPGIEVSAVGTTDKIQPAPMPWAWIGYAAVVSVVTLILGYGVFNRLKWRFVERP
jgi:lipopolysaccharide transport system permease protein